MQLAAAFRAFSAPGVRAPTMRSNIVVAVHSEAAQASSGSVPAAGTQQVPGQLRLKFGVKNIPHPNKAHYGGEDAFFVSEVGGGAAGIADGVGGWAESGINPADYSKNFMATARSYLEDCASLRPEVMSSGEWHAQQERQQQAAASSITEALSSSEARTAVEALDAAHRATKLPGSATACVLRLDSHTGELDAANLGDSGFLIIRQGRLHFQSPAMQHYFDCPLQFGMPPDTDYAQDAAVFSFKLQPGDVIVMATDGLLDNMQQEDIVRLAPRSAADVEQAAAALGELASRNAADPEYESPYTQGALEEGMDIPIWEKLLGAKIKDGRLELAKLRGGKMDDITVVCAVVVAAA